MKEFKNMQELILKAEELILRIEDANEEQALGRLELNRVTNETRQVVIRFGKMVEELPKLEERVNILVDVANEINPEKLRKEISDSFAGINIEFDWAEINKSIDLRLIKFFEDMHLNKFASHLDNHMDGYKVQCKQVDKNIKQLQALNNAVDSFEKHLLDLEYELAGPHTKENFIHWAILASSGAAIGSILTYLIMQ